MLHYVEKPETYVSDTINAGAYLFSSEIFKHMAQVFEEQYNNELVINFNWLSYVCAVYHNYSMGEVSGDLTLSPVVHIVNMGDPNVLSILIK